MSAQQFDRPVASGPAPVQGLQGRLWLARAALFWERLWPALWPALGVAGLFFVFALFDVLPALPFWLHVVILFLFADLMLFALWRGLRKLRWPGFGPARRRIETHSGLTHRPLAAIRDKLAAGANDPAAQALWDLHQKRARDSIHALRVGAPTPGLAKRDPYALRAGLLLLLAVGLVAAWGDGRDRILRAVWPGAAAANPLLALDVWITPPTYTGLAPIHLARSNQAIGPAGGEAVRGSAADQDGPIAVPVGSTVLAQLHGGRKTPTLALGETTAAFETVDNGAFRLSAPLAAPTEGAERLTVTQNGREIAGWSVMVLPDEAPEVALGGPPGRTERGALRLAFEGSDDYGLAGIQALLRRAATDGASAQPLALDLPLPRATAQTVDGRSRKTVKGASFHDLTAHPWAGLPVTLQLVAKDALGQVGASDPIPFVLPEREFRHPVARAIVELRKLLALSPRNREAVRNGLGDISEAPQSFGHDSVVFLALRSVVARLRHAGDEETVAAVQSTLWDTALRIEDGRLSLAERDLRDVQRALQEALERNADQAEIERLMNQLQQALNRFLQEMMQNAQQMPPQQMPFDPNARYMTSDDLQKMLDAAREMARSGATDAARDMLAQLQQMLESLQSGNFAQSQQQQQQQQQSAEMMRQLQELMRRQRELMEQTYRDAQGQRGPQGEQGQQGQQGNQATPEQQEALRRMLGEMMRQLGEMGGQIPEGFGQAERSMNEAGEALGSGQPGLALGPQGNALEQLQQGAGQMMQQLQQMMGQGQGPGQGQPGQMGQPGQPGGPQMPRPGDPRNFDPLGRSLPSSGTANDESGDRIPEAGDMMRSREILEELRRRAGEAERPRIERDYIDRLLRRF